MPEKSLGGAMVGFVVVLLLSSACSDTSEHRTAYFQRVEEGFLKLSDSVDGDVDGAIAKGLAALDLAGKADLDGKEAYLLLGRAFYMKKQYRKSIEELEKGLDAAEEIEFRNDVNYHLGLAYFRIYRDVQGEETFRMARECFIEASNIGNHQADAYYGLALLYALLHDKNPRVEFRVSIVDYLKQCQRIEAGMAGYGEGRPDSSCPNCYMIFEKKSESEEFIKWLKHLTGQ